LREREIEQESTPVDDRPKHDNAANDDAVSADESNAISQSASAATSSNMFAPSNELDEAATRSARKRAALWGFGTGMAMLVVVGLCLALAILASNG